MVWWEKAIAVLLAIGAVYVIGAMFWPVIYSAGVWVQETAEHWHEHTIDGHFERIERRIGQAEADIARLKHGGTPADDFETLEGSVVARPKRQVSVEHLPGGGVKIQLP